MKNAQVINLLDDAVLAFHGDSVIDNTDQQTLGDEKGYSSIQIDINFFDITSGLSVSEVADAELVYDSASNHWTVLLTGEGTPDIVSVLTDRHKYVGQVSPATAGGGLGLRAFSIGEFAVDNDSFEGTWMRFAYQVEVTGIDAWIRWYADGDLGGVVLFEAPAYEGGTGTTYATAPNRVTHRGAIVPA